MRDELSSDDEAAAIAALSAEFQRQAARVGVDWDIAATELRALVDWDSAATELRELAAETATTVDNNGEMALGLDLTTLLATLRGLPDHSGTAAFVAEFKRRAT
jgi:type IV pilus biogenesis protein CpaD/CtpE